MYREMMRAAGLNDGYENVPLLCKGLCLCTCLCCCLHGFPGKTKRR